MSYYHASTSVIHISDNEAVMFVHHAFSGMVGEDTYESKAYRMKFNPCSVPEMESLDYEKLREIYRKLKGKQERMEFWFAMKQMSPETIKENQRSTHAQIMSIIE